MTVDGIHRPSIRPRPAMRALRIDGASSVKITIRFLSGGNLRDKLIQILAHLWIGLNRQSIRRTFKYFVRIGVVERVRRRPLVRELFAAQRLGRTVEVVHPPGFLALLESERNGHETVGLNARGPEDVIEMNGGERNGLDRVIVGRRSSVGTGGERPGGQQNKKSE